MCDGRKVNVDHQRQTTDGGGRFDGAWSVAMSDDQISTLMAALHALRDDLDAMRRHSDRPPMVESARASVPTIAAIVVAACGLAWFTASIVGEIRGDIRAVRDAQGLFARDIDSNRNDHAQTRALVAQVTERMVGIEVKLAEMDDAIDETAPRTPQRAPGRGPAGRRYVTTSAGAGVEP